MNGKVSFGVMNPSLKCLEEMVEGGFGGGLMKSMM